MIVVQFLFVKRALFRASQHKDRKTGLPRQTSGEPGVAWPQSCGKRMGREASIPLAWKPKPMFVETASQRPSEPQPGTATLGEHGLFRPRLGFVVAAEQRTKRSRANPAKSGS